MRLVIKNMVCDRCKMVVSDILEEVGLLPISVELGLIELKEDHIAAVKDKLIHKLESVGFELLDDKRARTIERIKNLITDLVQNQNNTLSVNLSTYLSRHLHQDYGTLSQQFSDMEGITIEKYHILQKIEKVKELLSYDELSLSEIAFRLHYSSVAYLSNQFKKVTGMTPSSFRKIKGRKRTSLEEL